MIYTGDPERDALLVRIEALKELAVVEAYRYPGGGRGFLVQAEALGLQLESGRRVNG